MLVDKLIQRVEKSSYHTDSELACFRIFLGLFLLFQTIPSWSWLGELPQAFFFPPFFSVANLFNGFLQPEWYTFFDIIFYLAAAAITLGFYSRLFFLVAFVVMTIGNSFLYSLGKVDHGSILLLFLLLAMAFTNAGTSFALKKDKIINNAVQKISLGLFSIAIAFGLFSAGFHKLLQWIDFDLTTSGFLSWFYTGYFYLGRNDLLADLVFHLPVWFVEMMDYVAVAFEVSAGFFLLWGRNAWRKYLMLAIIFHVSNTLLLNISFTGNLPVYSLYLLSPAFLLFVRSIKNKRICRNLLIAVVLIRYIWLVVVPLTGMAVGGSGNTFGYYLQELLLWAVVFLIASFSFSRGLYERRGWDVDR